MDFHQIVVMLDIGLAALSAVLAVLNRGNAKAKNIAIAIAAAEHAIDKSMYTGDQLNAARLEFALAVLGKLMPKVNSATLRDDLEAVLAVIHTHAKETILP